MWVVWSKYITIRLCTKYGGLTQAREDGRDVSTAIAVTVLLLLLTIAGIIWAIATRKGALRIILPIIGILIGGFLSLMLIGMFAVNAYMPTSFDAATYNGPTGKVKVPFAGETMLMCQRVGKEANPKLMMFEATNGEATLPEGDFQLVVYHSTVADGSGRSCKVTGYYETPFRFSVSTGSPLSLNAGPPYVAAVVPMGCTSDRMELSLSITGAGGERCSIEDAATKDSSAAFEIRSKTGEILMNGKFEAG